jgi:protein-S-isoprenylcysteine O-methyltransferase Ste14
VSAIYNKLPPPLLMVIVGIAMWFIAKASPAIEMGGALRWSLVGVFAVIGFLMAAFGIRSFARADTTINPVDIDAASSLVTTGIYAYTRNPMYVSLTSLLLAWASYLQTPMALLGPLAFVLYITRFQIMPEERALGRLFGAAYEAYRGRVRRWL